MTIGSIAELPFVERPPLALLGFAGDRATLDLDYAGFGWARVGQLWLATEGGDRVAVDDALVLALHADDDGEALADDVELAFELPGGAVAALLSTFLARWLPRLPAARALVLAMCNPHHARLPRVAAAGGRPVHYGLGSVDAWLDSDAAGEHLRLAATAWRDATQEPA